MTASFLKPPRTVLKRPVLLLVLFLTTCASGAEWEQVTDGVRYRRVTRDTIDVHITRIDLTHPAIRVMASRADDAGLTVTDFAKKNDAIVAINGDYFDEQHQPLGLSMGPCGVWTEGDPKLQRRQGLVGVGPHRAEIQTRTMATRRWMRGAVSGWPALITACKPIAELPGSDHFTRAPHPRTAVGLSKDRKTMYFLVADGRREGVPGMTLPELAAFMHEELNACAAMNLDGGGSSAMWVRDRIVNKPSDPVERKVGNHLAVVRAGTRDVCDDEQRKAAKD
jgi:exopolysaccharide biosynthesis protein